MLKFEEAFEIVTGSARRLGSERVELSCTLGRVLAETIVSDTDMPPFNKSAMDGFACRRADLGNELTVIESIPAGFTPTKTIGPNQCAKIMTGAVVPDGADCVIMKEHTKTVGENTIRFTDVQTKTNICLKGEDVKKDDVVLGAGEIIKPQHIAVLATCGRTNVSVSLRPRVGIIATGDELVEPSVKPSACQIRNSNGLQLVAQVKIIGAIARDYSIAVDTKEALDEKVKKALAENDVVVLAGGVSVGDCDLVRPILKENNVKLLFEQISVKPGRPMVFGILGDDRENKRHVFGLPGNPVSTFIMFELLVKPFLYKMSGHDLEPDVTHKQLEKTITRRKTDRDAWLPVIFTDDGKVAKLEYHGSAHINALCKADGLICMPAGTAEMKEGVTVAVRQI